MVLDFVVWKLELLCNKIDVVIWSWGPHGAHQKVIQKESPTTFFPIGKPENKCVFPKTMRLGQVGDFGVWFECAPAKSRTTGTRSFFKTWFSFFLLLILLTAMSLLLVSSSLHSQCYVLLIYFSCCGLTVLAKFGYGMIRLPFIYKLWMLIQDLVCLT